MSPLAILLMIASVLLAVIWFEIDNRQLDEERDERAAARTAAERGVR